MADPAPVRGVVLAGGDSTRFGDGDKALATLDGRPLLAHVVEALSTATGATPLVAVGSDDEADRYRSAVEVPFEAVVDRPGWAGPLAGLLAAAEAADETWLLVCGCDMPLVTAEGFEALLAAAGVPAAGPVAPRAAEVAAVVPVVDGHDQPLHALYRRRAVREARADLPPAAGPRALLSVLAPVVRVPATAVEAPLATAVTNGNTREELDRLRDP